MALSPGDARWYATYAAKMGKWGPQLRDKGRSKSDTPSKEWRPGHTHSLLLIFFVVYDARHALWDVFYWNGRSILPLAGGAGTDMHSSTLGMVRRPDRLYSSSPRSNRGQ